MRPARCYCSLPASHQQPLLLHLFNTELQRHLTFKAAVWQEHHGAEEDNPVSSGVGNIKVLKEVNNGGWLHIPSESRPSSAFNGVITVTSAPLLLCNIDERGEQQREEASAQQLSRKLGLRLSLAHRSLI